MRTITALALVLSLLAGFVTPRVARSQEEFTLTCVPEAAMACRSFVTTDVNAAWFAGEVTLFKFTVDLYATRSDAREAFRILTATIAASDGVEDAQSTEDFGQNQKAFVASVKVGDRLGYAGYEVFRTENVLGVWMTAGYDVVPIEALDDVKRRMSPALPTADVEPHLLDTLPTMIALPAAFRMFSEWIDPDAPGMDADIAETPQPTGTKSSGSGPTWVESDTPTPEPAPHAPPP